jgi:hypothetical protein
VPDPPGFVVQKIEAEGQKGVCQISGGIEQQSYAIGMFRLNGEVVRLFRFDPCGAKR